MKLIPIHRYKTKLQKMSDKELAQQFRHTQGKPSLQEYHTAIVVEVNIRYPDKVEEVTHEE